MKAYSKKGFKARTKKEEKRKKALQRTPPEGTPSVLPIEKTDKEAPKITASKVAPAPQPEWSLSETH